MNKICEKCLKDPQAHSFQLLKGDSYECYYYTCPANATHYDDAEGIINHMRIELNKINKPWIWIFDCQDYGLKHLAAANVGFKIANFLNSDESIGLEKIIVINESTTSKIMFNTFWYLLDKKITDIIIYDKLN